MARPHDWGARTAILRDLSISFGARILQPLAAPPRSSLRNSLRAAEELRFGAPRDEQVRTPTEFFAEDTTFHHETFIIVVVIVIDKTVTYQQPSFFIDTDLK